MTAERNLVLVHTPGYQAVEDFQSIGRAVQELAPDIEVFVASNSISSSVTRRQAGRRPSLIFSPGKLLSFSPLRGKVYAGSPIPKLEQIERFQAVAGAHGLVTACFDEVPKELHIELIVLHDQDGFCHPSLQSPGRRARCDASGAVTGCVKSEIKLAPDSL